MPQVKKKLAQPEEQGNCRGNATSGENGEGVDEANRATVIVTNAVENLEPPQMSSDQSRGEGGGEDISWINPRKHPLIQRDDAESIPERRDDAESIPERRDDAESVPARRTTQSLSPRTLRIPNQSRRHQWTTTRAYRRVSTSRHKPIS
jgi:hypothetical protein